MPKNKRSRFDPAPLDLEEMERDPSLGGLTEYLSTLLTTPQPLHRQAAAEKEPPTVEMPPEAANTDPPINLTPDISLVPDLNLTPGAELKPRRRFPAREAKLAQDGHTRAEQQVYEALWETGRPFDDMSRLITIGFGGLARLARLSESNARINLRSLVRKLAVEEHAGYDCERGRGRTYRVFNYLEILRRRRAVGLTWYSKRTLAVVFVDPATGAPVNLDQKPGPGLNLTSAAAGPGVNLIPEPGLNLTPGPGPNLTGAYREIDLENSFRETSSSVSALAALLAQYTLQADDDALRTLVEACRTRTPDATTEEIVHFTRLKLQQLRSMTTVRNPVGFLQTAVPPCLDGELLRRYRQLRAAAQHQSREAAQALNQRLQAVLEDPNTPEEDKQIARQSLQDHPPARSR